MAPVGASGGQDAKPVQPNQPLPPQQGQVIPQSFEGTGDVDPYLIRTQATATPAPSSGATAKSDPNDPTVQTPAGAMPKSEAMRRAAGLAAIGQNGMSKLFADSVPVAGGIGKDVRNDMEKAQLSAIEQRSRVENIMEMFDPEWLTVDGKLKMAGLNWVDSVGPLRDKIAPESREKMSRYNAFTTAAFRNINEYVKEVTGAAMGIEEEARIRKGTPDPQKDGPQQFLDKSNATLRIAKMAEVRMRHMVRNGLQFDRSTIEKTFPLERMEGMINQRATQLQKILKDRNVPAEQMPGMIREQLKKEFEA
jgi:hypothetical protein